MKASFVVSALILVSTILAVASFPVENSAEAASAPSTPSWLDCEICKVAVGSLQAILNRNSTFEDVYPIAVKICILLLKEMKANGDYMCPGIISAYTPPVVMVATQILLNPDTICKDLFLCTLESKPLTSFKDLNVQFRKIMKKLQPFVKRPSTKTPPFMNFSPSDFLSKREENGPSRKSKSEKITFVQLSDIHLDLEYSEGSPTDCGLYFCCRRWYNGTGSAGYYGSFQCDIPIVTLDMVLDEVRNLRPSPDFILYSGDNPPHDIWNQSWSTQLQATKTVVDYLAVKLPGVRIFPALGNHETWPESEYLGTLKEYKALTQNLSEIWEKWVKFSPAAKATIAHGGYYSMQVSEGLRIISFNSDYGYSLNFYALLNYENKHYTQQLEWLKSELEKAESNYEKVLLMTHIPPGDSDNNAEYGSFYLSITRRFKDTIIGHFSGHTHLDQFQLVQDEAGVYGVVMVAPSVTTFNHINPSFRVFSMDSDFMLLGYTQYHLNLTRANDFHLKKKDENVQFEIAYTTKYEYQLDDLSPLSWSKLSKNFVTNNTLMNSYNYNRFARSKEEDKTCDLLCQKKRLCEVNNIISCESNACLFELK